MSLTPERFPKEHIEAAVFSRVVYEAHRSSKVIGNNSWERLQTALRDPKIVSVIGSGWTVRKGGLVFQFYLFLSISFISNFFFAFLF